MREREPFDLASYAARIRNSPCFLSLGSQQGNRHVQWHIALLPPGVPFNQQQFEALMLSDKGYLKIPDAELSELAARLGRRIALPGQGGQ